MLIIGREPASDGARFDDEIARSAASFGGPVAIVVARGAHRRGRLDGPLNILVPITGTSMSRQGAELAITLAQGSRGRLSALYVSPGVKPQAQDVSRAAIDEIIALGRHYDVDVRGLIRKREATPQAILREAQSGGFDLLVLGVSPRPGEQLFFGDVAADLLANAGCSIVFLSSEPITAGASLPLTSGPPSQNHAAASTA